MFYVFGSPSIEEKDKKFGISNYLKLMLDGTATGKINGSIMWTYKKEKIAESDAIILRPICGVYKNSITMATGNCINIITDYETNYGAGNQLKDYVVTGGTVATDGYQEREVPYGDNNGQAFSIRVTNVGERDMKYYETYSPTNDIKKLPEIGIGDTNDTWINFGAVSQTYNKHLNFIKQIEQEININKDNREVLHINQQHHFLSNDNNVKVGNAMADKCPLIQDITYTTKIVFLNNEIDDYEFKINSNDILLSYNISQYASYKVENNQELLLPFMTETITPQTDVMVRGLGTGVVAKAWALVTNTNDLLVGRNETIQDGDVCTAIYLSVTSNYL